VRFPGVYRALAESGAFVPHRARRLHQEDRRSNWHNALRARAIGDGCFVFAPRKWQARNKREDLRPSLIIAPWGEVLPRGHESGVFMARIDPRGRSRTEKRAVAADTAALHVAIQAGRAPATWCGIGMIH